VLSGGRGASAWGLPEQGAARLAIQQLTRVQADFPQPGVLFRDLSPVLADPAGFRDLVLGLRTSVPDEDEVDIVAGLESRGFILAAALAVHLGTGMLAVRKPGKVAGEVIQESYALEYGTATLELNPGDVPDGARVLIVDDVLATGGTGAAAHRLLTRAGAVVTGLAVAIEIPGLGGRQRLRETAPGLPVFSLVS